MTRFARAKGSKASNERLPETATSWSEMKQQLLEKNKEIEESKKRQRVIDQRNASYKAFLKEKEESESKDTKWADFPGGTKPVNQGKKKLKKKAVLILDDLVIKKPVDETKDRETSHSKQKSENVDENLNKLIVNEESDSDAPPEEESAKQEITPPKIKKVKQKKKLLKIIVDRKENTRKTQDPTDDKSKNKRKLDRNDESKKKKVKKSNSEITNETEMNGKLKKKEIPQKKIIKEDLTEKDLKKIEKKKQKRIRQMEKKKRVKAKLKQKKEEMEKEQRPQENGNDPDTADKSENNRPSNKSEDNKFQSKKDSQMFSKPFQKSFDKQSKFNTKDKVRSKENEQHPRRKPQLPNVMFINGKEVQINYVDGFPVKKEDAERLKKLRREMISKGLPRSEINGALKLERRRAEKAFAREKKKVCFHCRKSGHNLSECPELDKDEVVQTAGSGICFKCGSTEHTHFECKVVRGADYKFAQCFICNEQGHIARQCPDNARGLYPKGGACRECGDVTHLKQNCPKYQAKQQKLEEGLTIEIFGASNPDVLEDKNDDRLGKTEVKKMRNKIIKF